MVAEVKTLRTSTVRDVPAKLRQLAEQIEAGAWGDTLETVCCINHPDGVQVYIWGDCDPKSAYVLLNKCAAKVLDGI